MSGDKPWIDGNLRFSAEVLTHAQAHALREYPSESCGFIKGPAADPLLANELIEEVNEADKYHKLDPVHFPRTSTTYFKINELRATRAFEEGEQAGRPIKVIYHSHCDAGAYFSEEDAATFAHEGQLMWPCAFLVTSVMQGQLAEQKLWVFDANTQRFVESPFESV